MGLKKLTGPPAKWKTFIPVYTFPSEARVAQPTVWSVKRRWGVERGTASIRRVAVVIRSRAGFVREAIDLARRLQLHQAVQSELDGNGRNIFTLGVVNLKACSDKYIGYPTFAAPPLSTIQSHIVLFDDALLHSLTIDSAVPSSLAARNTTIINAIEI
jgi:hypothetical protein